MANKIKIFEQSKIRSVYDEEKDIWYFSVVDVVAILIDKGYQTARKYWNKLSERLRKERASEPVTNCHQLKLEAADGKKYLTTVATAETMTQNKKVARRGGGVAKIARQKYEEETGQKVVTDENYLPTTPKQKKIDKKYCYGVL